MPGREVIFVEVVGVFDFALADTANDFFLDLFLFCIRCLCFGLG